MKTLISHDRELYLGGTAKPGIRKTLVCRSDLRYLRGRARRDNYASPSTDRRCSGRPSIISIKRLLAGRLREETRYKKTMIEFGKILRGTLIERDHPDYEAARKLYNGMIDKRPLMIARCADVADVITAVNFGRENELLIAIRGGGHNGPGLGSCDDGLVIDLSMMKGVHVDPANRTVRVGPGCTQGDVDHATHPFGLAVPAGIVSTTGIAGLTLGGGTGYLTRKYGLTIDSLIEADVVLADGSFVTANETANSDLLWGLRGGGGNFGVVTSFLFRAHPVSMVYAGPIFWDQKHARALMQRYRDFLPSAPEELGSFLGLKTVLSTDPFPREHWGKRACALVSCYNGSAELGEKAMAPILRDLPPPMFNWMGVMPFPSLQGMFDPFLPKGLQWYLEGRLRESSARRGDRRPHRTGGEYAERAVTDASLPNRWRSPPHRQGGDGLECKGRDLVDGHRRNRSESPEGRGVAAMGQVLLGSLASFQSGRRLRELHDGRRR